MTRLVLLALLAASRLAYADAPEPCTDSVNDPIVTPVRDRLLDAQRGACLRDEASAGLLAHALVDADNFHGVLGGALVLAGRIVVKRAHELSVQLPVFDYTFVQTAVNKVTHASIGPLVLGAAAGGAIGQGARAALALRVELPYATDTMTTFGSSAQLAGLVTGALARRVIVHARLGAVGMIAASPGGTTRRLALFAGTDLAWHVRPRLALHAGADVMAGWRAGLDHVLVRTGVHWRVSNTLRVRFGSGVPLGGAEPTNAIVDVGLVVDR